MLSFLSKFHFLINLIIKIFNLFPRPIIHNFEKISTFRRVFFYVNFEMVEGDYVEFGVYEGTSLINAYYANKSTSKIDKLVMTKDALTRKFIGFDSFEEGFKYFDEKDKHQNWTEKLLYSSYEKTIKRLNKISSLNTFYIVKGFVENTLSKIESENNIIQKHNLNKVAVALFDVDLKSPTLAGLRFVYNKLQKGSILIFDDYFMYKADRDKGERGALETFLSENKDVELIDFGNYGNAGKIFIVSNINN